MSIWCAFNKHLDILIPVYGLFCIGRSFMSFPMAAPPT